MQASKTKPLWSILQWFTHGERGASSETIMAHLGACRGPNQHDTPRDPCDLRRCRIALERTGTESRIGECASISPAWARIVEAWPELCATMDAECPTWPEGHGRAPRTYAMLQTLAQGADHAG
jgi:hypothetical protein